MVSSTYVVRKTPRGQFLETDNWITHITEDGDLWATIWLLRSSTMLDITSHLLFVSNLMSRQGVREQNQSKCVSHDQVCVIETDFGSTRTGRVKKKCPKFERLLLPEYISNDILQYLIE